MDSPPSQRAFRYARQVEAGEIPVCRFVTLACARFLRDLEREDWIYRYDEALADHAARWIEMLPHTKGRWAAKQEPIVLQGWQCFLVCNLFGWIHRETGLRRFREAYVEVPRKSGKSLLAAAIGAYMFAADGDFGAEVFSGATTEQQAWEVFRPARQFAERLPLLRETYGIEVHAKSLSIPANGSRFAPVIGKPGDGASPSCALIDEFHEHQTADLYSTMRTGMGAREQPLLFVITTAGVDFGGPCYERRSDAIRVLEGTVEDDTLFVVIYTIDDDDQWDSEESVRKANPNFGISVSAEFLLQEMARARRSASAQNAFKTKHLNVWVGARTAWLNMLALQRCKRPDLARSAFAGVECVIGLDLASKVDVASMAILFRDGEGYAGFWRHYLPEETVLRSSQDRYRAWADVGLLVTTPGEVIDFDFIEQDLREIAAEHVVREVAFDPYQATQFCAHMEAEGFEMVEVRPTVLSFSEPMKALEALILSKKFTYDGDPVATWMFGNVVAKADAKDNIYPRKDRDELKIDGVVALLMALNRMMAAGPAEHSGELLVV